MYQQYLLLFFLLSLVNSELFTSVSHLYSSVHAANDLAVTLRNYAQANKDRKNIRKLAELSDSMEKHCSTIINDPLRYIANPIGAFLFIKRFALDWERDVAAMVTGIAEDEKDVAEINEICKSLPTYEDLKGVAAGLFRVQDTYKLNATRLAEGYINELYVHTLSAEDCYELGRLAYELKKYRYVYIWMEISLDKQRTETIQNVSRIELLDYAIHGRELVGQIEQALSLTNEQLILDPGLQRALKRKEKYLNILRRGKLKNTVSSKAKERRKTDIACSALCRGENVIRVEHSHRLRCRYHSNNKHPRLILQPVKEEVLHISPKVVFYHDFISDGEIEEIISVSMDRLERSRIHRTGKTIHSDYRIAKHAFLDMTATKADWKLQIRIEAITGLSMRDSEALQVANYGIGGYYRHHSDYIDVKTSSVVSDGNRIATWLNYLSDVEGGATVFPYLGVRILPKKGSAVFWYNTYRNGLPNDMTFHAACPVLIGSKWVSTYWIREKGQEFKRPCSTNREE